jgi:hypothetical protein
VDAAFESWLRAKKNEPVHVKIHSFWKVAEPKLINVLPGGVSSKLQIVSTYIAARRQFSAIAARSANRSSVAPRGSTYGFCEALSHTTSRLGAFQSPSGEMYCCPIPNKSSSDTSKRRSKSA